MPFFKHNDRLVYFSHVPKSGGTSIEYGLTKSGIKLSFMDGKWRYGGPVKWSRTSPQHILNKDAVRLLDMSLFDFKFACVRDPVARFLSAFNHNRQIGLISPSVSVARFLSTLEKRGDFFTYEFDNHFVPAADIVPDGCKVFRLESGLDRIADWLRTVTGDERLDVRFEREHNRDWDTSPRSGSFIKRKLKERLRPRMPELSGLDRGLRARIEKLYSRDYERFFSVSPRGASEGAECLRGRVE